MVNYRLRFVTILSVVLLAAALLPQGAASTGSGSARPNGGKWAAGLELLANDMEFDLVKRQATTTPVASAPPPPATTAAITTLPPVVTTPVVVTTPSTAPPLTTAISDTLLPSASSPVQSPSIPSSPPDAPSITSSIVSPPSVSTPDTPSVTSTILPTPSISTPNIPAITTPVLSSSVSSPSTVIPTSPLNTATTVTRSSITSTGSTIGDSITITTAVSTVLSPVVSPPSGSSNPASDGTTTDALNPLPGGTTTQGDPSTTGVSSTGILSPSSGQTGGTNDTAPTTTRAITTSTSTSYSLSFAFQTVTDSSGVESISISTASIPETTMSVTMYAGPSQSAAPLVVQECPPNNPPPQVTLDYLPSDVWATTGSSATNETSTGTSGPNGPPHQSITSLCNNGTKASNKIGAAIHLQFTGTEVFLLMVPGLNGGAYDVKLDDEDPKTLNNYKPDVTSCEVSTAWNRTDLVNKPHDITIIVKGAAAGSTTGGSQIEFNGLIFKGPKAEDPLGGTSKWIIVGVSIGTAIIVIALIVIVVICIKRKRNARAAAGGGSPSSDVPFPGVNSPRPQTMISGHTRSDSNFSATPYNPNVSSPQQQPWQIPPSGHARSQSDTTSFQQQAWSPPTHSRNLSEGPVMHGQQLPPWHSTSPVMSNVTLGNTYPVTQSSPPPRQSFAGYGNGQERQSHAQTHNRTTSYASDGRNPFE